MSAVTVLDGPDALRAAQGTHLGFSEWISIEQERIDLFAQATGDHQWIHTDVERAATGPFGSTIAHGYLTLALSNYFMPQILEVRGFSAGINTGTERIRFLTPVPVGARLRAGAELVAVDELGDGSVFDTRILVTIELEGSEKPACVINARSRWLR